MRVRHILGAAAIAGALTLSGCADNGDTTSSNNAGGQPTSSQQAFNSADVTFAQDMIPHHQQAVQMAQMAATQAESEEVRQLAADIESAQGPEIEIMTGWLESWGEEVPDTMTGMDHASMGDMPGMMTTEQMDDLMAASGAAFDQMFLTMMIAHHEGAIEMARTEQEDGQFPDAVDLAMQIEAQQTGEITVMRDLLGS